MKATLRISGEEFVHPVSSGGCTYDADIIKCDSKKVLDKKDFSFNQHLKEKGIKARFFRSLGGYYVIRSHRYSHFKKAIKAFQEFFNAEIKIEGGGVQTHRTGIMDDPDLPGGWDIDL